jgi:L-lactate dehydrogenase complex protein LldF
VTHAERAAEFLRDPERARWHDASLWSLREKRDRAAAAVPDWEALREAAAAIKRHTLAALPFYLVQFEQRAQARGAVVHWARDAAEHNQIVEGLLREAGATRVVKSKSMLTEECGLNPWLEARGVELVDTDLGERIVQLRRERPSHIVMPAIHLRRKEIGALFHAELGTPAGLDDPTRLTLAARTDLRRRFLGAQAGITGVNFAIAETGGIVVCTNEGNADLGTALPPLHIACMGIEKLIPRAADLPVFLRLLARSATGQAQTAYTSHFHGPSPGGALHIVLVDNGRSALRARGEFGDALACIRCGACMNTCPVFRRSGGHSYDAVIPGPIGAVLEPSRAPDAHASLPQACTLCGSCRDVCPVRIDLPNQILAWRSELLGTDPHAVAKQTALRAARYAFEHPAVYAALGALVRLLARALPERWLSGRWNRWTRGRALPDVPKRSFRAELARRRR